MAAESKPNEQRQYEQHKVWNYYTFQDQKGNIWQTKLLSLKQTVVGPKSSEICTVLLCTCTCTFNDMLVLPM